MWVFFPLRLILNGFLVSYKLEWNFNALDSSLRYYPVQRAFNNFNTHSALLVSFWKRG